MLGASHFKCVFQRIPSVLASDVRWMGRFIRSDTPKMSPEIWELKQTRLFNPNDAPRELPTVKPYRRKTSRGHPERPKYVDEYIDPFPKGKVYEKYPLKIPLVAGKTYSWCTCGLSHSQPFCDGTHKTAEGTSFNKHGPKFRPHKFTVEESMDYYLCNCKQTDDRPFCDGTHKTLPDQKLLFPDSGEP